MAATPAGNRPLVVAHRGASEQYAEHTLRAYLTALEEGADGLECDVRLTADGHLVCVHDRDLRRLASSQRLVSTTELARLDELDVSGWKHPLEDSGTQRPALAERSADAALDPDSDPELDPQSDPDSDPELDPQLDKVLPLRLLLETVADYDRPVQLSIETKHPTRFGGLVEKRLVDLLDKFGWAGADSPVRVMSFSWMALRRVERLAPALELVCLFESPTEWAKAWAAMGRHWVAGPGIELLREHPELARRVARRARVHCWVVNTPEDIELCRSLGVEAVITDRPAETLEHLRAGG